MRAATRDLAEALSRLAGVLAKHGGASSASTSSSMAILPSRGCCSVSGRALNLKSAPLQAKGARTSPRKERSEMLKELLSHSSRPAWQEPGMTPQRAAETLGAFLGIEKDSLKPGDVVDVPQPSMLRLLEQASGGIADLGDARRPVLERMTEKQAGYQQRGGSVASRSSVSSLSSSSSLEPLNDLDRALFVHADSVTRRFFGDQVYLRGIVEFSNVCANDCGYCGIRKFQRGVKRYTMKEEEIVEAAEWALEHGMGTLMLQSGELPTEQRLAFVERVVRRVRAVRRKEETGAGAAVEGAAVDTPSSSSLAVALSIGELDSGSYRRMVDAGASRYLLRIETSNPRLFAALHPPKQRWDARLRSLRDAKEAGLQLGTGVMVGLPGQTLADLAADLVFFKEIGADMIGIGPYITEPGTPVAARWEAEFGSGGGGGGGGGDSSKRAHMEAMVSLTTRVNALARITLGNVNVAATTALQALHPRGRELALRRGANVLMPILTPTRYRADYSLYEGKPCITDTAAGCEACLSARVASVGLTVARGVWGDPPHATRAVEPDAVVFEEEEEESPATAPRPRRSSNSSGVVGVGGSGEGSAGKGKASGGGQQRRSFSSGARSHVWSPSLPSSFSTSLSSYLPFPPCPGGPNTPRQRRRNFLTKEDTSALPRTNVAFVGRMNSGKSTALCALAPGAAIVDATPGTTADVKVALAEGHGENLGPLKLMDTAGVDEAGVLGAKKRDKAFRALRESDVAVVVVDVAATLGASTSSSDPFSWERELLAAARDAGATPLLLLNMKSKRSKEKEFPTRGTTTAVDENADALPLPLLRDAAHAARDALDPEHSILALEIDLADAKTSGELGSQQGVSNRLSQAIAAAVASRGGPAAPPPALPPKYLSRDAAVLLVIPMDAETPGGRLLRPQALVQEELLRAYARVVAVRLDLGAARGERGAEAQRAERQRFDEALASTMLVTGRGGSDRCSNSFPPPPPPPRLVVTDSQAIDVVHEWTLSGEEGREEEGGGGGDADGDNRAAAADGNKRSSSARRHRGGSPLVDVTTFSIAMAARQSGGAEQLALMVEGIAAARRLREGARVLVAEACNHNRITQACNDIGLVQIPKALEKIDGEKTVELVHAFGRELPELSPETFPPFGLAVHCGGCLIDSQAMRARLRELRAAGVPVTNYGLLLSAAAGMEAFERVVAPWGIELCNKEYTL